jgi:hypothetical protein
MEPPGRCFVDDAADIALVDRAALVRLGCKRRRAIDDRQRNRVQRAHLESGEIGRALTHLVLGSHVEGHQADRSRRYQPVVEQVACPLGEHARLARTGRSDDSCRATGVGDCGKLVRCKLDPEDLVGAQRCERTVLQRDAVHDRQPVRERKDRHRPAIEPGVTTVGQHDVTRVGRHGAELDGGIQQPPRWCASTDVHRVAPHQVIELFEFEGEVGADFMERTTIDLQREFVESNPQVEHRALARRGTFGELHDDRARVDDHCLVDHEDQCIGPRGVIGDGCVNRARRSVDDQVPSERIGPYANGRPRTGP